MFLASQAGLETSTGMDAPYSSFRIDSFDPLQIDFSCTVAIGGEFTFVGTAVIPDEEGSFQAQGTVDIATFLFGGESFVLMLTTTHDSAIFL